MPHVLDPIVVYDPEGHEVRLGQLWADRTVVLVFVRHFGCVFCKQQLAEISPLRDRVRGMGADIVVIGQGSVEEARAFRHTEKVTLPLLTDPSRASYCALDMRRGPTSVLRLSVVTRALAAWRAGFRQSRVAGDPLQQGGVLVIAPGGIERFRYLSQGAGDHPPPTRMLDALDVQP
jgi:peroxiredoxin